jgi:predicted nucleotide-binding protein
LLWERIKKRSGGEWGCVTGLMITKDNYPPKKWFITVRSISFIVASEGFWRGLKNQISEGFNQKFISVLRDLYHNDQASFLGLSLLLSGGFLAIISVIITALLQYSSHDIEHYQEVMNTTFPLFVVSFILMGVSAVIFTIRGSRYRIQSKNKIPSKINKKIFIIHGHDSITKGAVTNFLEDLDLIPIVLKDVSNRGRTIIEKVEYYVNQTSFAIAILTKDDFGISKSDCNVETEFNSALNKVDATNLVYNVRETFYDQIEVDEVEPFFELVDLSKDLTSKILPRTRQNVIFEIGLTFGYLDRHNVLLLYEEGVELPSDLDGLTYYPLNSDWKKMVIKDLLAAGILDKNCTLKFNKSLLDYLFIEEDISELQLSLSDFDNSGWVMETPKRVDTPYPGWQFASTYINKEKNLRVSFLIHRYLSIEDAKKGFHSAREQFASRHKDGRLFAPRIGEENYGYVSDTNVEVATFRRSNLLITTCFYVTNNPNSIVNAERFAQLVDQKMQLLVNKRYFN